ncbi:hypothetical protein [Flavobacterium sp.]|jgi:hypothetical protein|uniref:hypothetical protein n=1 Tax=Flavobacterium sp. TaxID=239 RepID=UPI0037C02392
MNKIIRIIKLLVFSIFLVNCSSDNATPEPEIPDNIRPPYTVKYEIIFPQNAWSSRTTQVSCTYENNGHWYILGEQGTIFWIDNNNLNQGFAKTFTVTVNINPLQLHLSTNYNPSTSSNVTFKIYVNNILVEQATRTMNPYTGVDSFNGTGYSVY